jgi:hypothetical protein
MEARSRHVETDREVKRPSLVLAVLVFLCLPGVAHARVNKNPFGVTVVRFVAGTTPAKMRAAVSATKLSLTALP